MCEAVHRRHAVMRSGSQARRPTATTESLVRRELRQIVLIKHRDKRAQLAFERRGEPDHRHQVRRPAAVFQLAEPGLWQIASLRELDLRPTALLTQSAEARAEHLSDRACHCHESVFNLTKGGGGYPRFRIATKAATMLDPALIQRIRTIFLHHEPRVTIAGAAGLLGWRARRSHPQRRDRGGRNVQREEG